MNFRVLPDVTQNRVRLTVEGIDPTELADLILSEIHKSAWVTRRTKVKITKAGAAWDVAITCNIVKEMDRAPVRAALRVRLKNRGLTELED